MPALIPEPVNNPAVALKPGIADISDDVCTWAFHAGCPVRNVWGTTTFPDHSDGQCLDFMITSKANGDRLAQYLIDNADRLGLQWLIWYRRIYRFQDTDRGHGWAAYTGTSNPHTDHVHAQFRPGFKPGAKPAISAAVTTSQGDKIIMANPVKLHRYQDVHLAHAPWVPGKSAGFVTMPVKDNSGNLSIISGPGTIDVLVNLVTSADCWARFITVDYDDTGKPRRDTKIISPYPKKRIKAGGDQIELYDSIGAGPAGWSRRVRLQVWASTGPVTVQEILYRAGKA